MREALDACRIGANSSDTEVVKEGLILFISCIGEGCSKHPKGKRGIDNNRRITSLGWVKNRNRFRSLFSGIKFVQRVRRVKSN